MDFHCSYMDVSIWKLPADFHPTSKTSILIMTSKTSIVTSKTSIFDFHYFHRGVKIGSFGSRVEPSTHFPNNELSWVTILSGCGAGQRYCQTQVSTRYNGAASLSLLRLGVSSATCVWPLPPFVYYPKQGGDDRPRGNGSSCMRNTCRLLHRVVFVGALFLSWFWMLVCFV